MFRLTSERDPAESESEKGVVKRGVGNLFMIDHHDFRGG